MKQCRKIPMAMLPILIIIAMVLMGPASSSADIYMKQKQHTDAMRMMGMEQPAQDSISEIWITENGFRSDSSSHSSIMLAKEQKMIMIDHMAKTYMEHPMNMNDGMGAVTDDAAEKKRPEMTQMMQNMMKMDVSVEETSETRTINKWKCRKYIMRINSAMGGVTNEVWATEDLKVDKKMYDQLSTHMLSAMPGLQRSMEEMEKEMGKIKGVQVLTLSSVTMMGQTQKSSTELLEFGEGKAPADVFAIPAGYQKMER